MRGTRTGISPVPEPEAGRTVRVQVLLTLSRLRDRPMVSVGNLRRPMVEIRHQDYVSFFLRTKHVEIGGSRIALLGPREITTTAPQESYLHERNTVWSFPERGKWATHDGQYRGNWSPFVPRNLILRYTAP